MSNSSRKRRNRKKRAKKQLKNNLELALIGMSEMAKEIEKLKRENYQLIKQLMQTSPWPINQQNTSFGFLLTPHGFIAKLGKN